MILKIVNSLDLNREKESVDLIQEGREFQSLIEVRLNELI